MFQSLWTVNLSEHHRSRFVLHFVCWCVDVTLLLNTLLFSCSAKAVIRFTVDDCIGLNFMIVLSRDATDVLLHLCNSQIAL